MYVIRIEQLLWEEGRMFPVINFEMLYASYVDASSLCYRNFVAIWVKCFIFAFIRVGGGVC